MLLQIYFQLLNVLGIHSSVEQSPITRYQKDMGNLRMGEKKKKKGIEQVELKTIMILGVGMMVKGCAMKASPVKERSFMLAMQWNSSSEVCAGSLSFGSLWLLRRAQTPSLPWDFFQFF